MNILTRISEFQCEQTIIWMNFCFKIAIQIGLVNIVTNNDESL